MNNSMGSADIKIYIGDKNHQPFELVAEYDNYKDALLFKGSSFRYYIYVVDGNHLDFKNFKERASLFID